MWLGIVLACAAAAAQTALYAVNAVVFDYRIDLFEIQEGGLVTWAAASTTFTAGAFALLVGVVDPAERWRGTAVALGLAFLSLDDAVVIHEELAFRATDALSVSRTYAQVLWPAAYLPLLVVVTVLLVRLARGAADALRMVVAGLGLLAAGVALEVAGVRVDRPPLEKSAIVLEEAVEIAGWVLVATGMAIRLVTLPRMAVAPVNRPARDPA